MKKLLLLVLITTLMTAKLSFANDYILTATNQEDNETVSILMQLDENEDITGVKLDYVIPSGEITRTIKGSIDQASTEGITIREQNGKNVVMLRTGSNFSSHQGGDVVIDYLFNGLIDDRRELVLDISRDADKWSVKLNQNKVHKLHFITNKKPIIGAIGIKEIQIID